MRCGQFLITARQLPAMSARAFYVFPACFFRCSSLIPNNYMALRWF